MIKDAQSAVIPAETPAGIFVFDSALNSKPAQKPSRIRGTKQTIAAKTGLIESSIAPLSKAGIKLHLGKGELHKETIEALDRFNAVYAVIPPVTALLEAKTSERKVLAFPELGMEALHLIKVEKYPAIIGAAHGRSIYEK